MLQAPFGRMLVSRRMKLRDSHTSDYIWSAQFSRVKLGREILEQ